MRREVSQPHSCDCIGKDEEGTLKVWVAAPHKQATVSSRREAMTTDEVITKLCEEYVEHLIYCSLLFICSCRFEIQT
jgi:hypothetical protein